MMWGMEKYHRFTKIYWSVCRPLDSLSLRHARATTKPTGNVEAVGLGGTIQIGQCSIQRHIGHQVLNRSIMMQDMAYLDIPWEDVPRHGIYIS